jgi:ABC-type transport system involved in multi-copper enzyme maturation permease subunit
MIIKKAVSNFQSGNSMPVDLFNQFNPYKFPYAWHTFSYLGKFFKIILAIVVINIICYEFQNGTYKQNIIHGLKRWEFLFSKFLIVVSLSLLSTVTISIAIVIAGIMYSNPSDIAFMENVHYLLLSFLNTFTYLSMAVMFAILLKNTMTAFMILMALWFPGDLLWLLIIPNELAAYRPFEIIDELLPFTKHDIPVRNLVTVCFAYLGLYWSLSLFNLKKDLN